MNPWLLGNAPRGDDYDALLQARAGLNPHGEADFTEDIAQRLLQKRPASVLEGGCGTGRIAVELTRRGFDVVGVDIDPAMLATAQRKAPQLVWTLGDLATVSLDRTFDLAVLAGNTMIFVGRGNELPVLSNVAKHLTAGGLLVAGFQLQADGLALAEYQQLALTAQFELVELWATWHREKWDDASDYAVCVHRLIANI